MAYNMSDEEKLARDLASRGVSRFTEVSGGPSYNLCGYIFGVGVLFLLLHVGAFFNIYAVQFSRFSGNYAETKATVVSHSSQREYVYHINSFPKDHDFPKKHNDKLVEVSEVTTYYIKAVGDDGTEFNFEGSANYGKKGSRLRIKYSKIAPGIYRYVAANDLFHMPFDRYFGLAVLVLSFLAFAGTYAVFRWKRKCQMDVESGPYLPVLRTSRCEVRTVYISGNSRSRSPVKSSIRSRKEYAPVFRYAMPDGTELLFQGKWTRKYPGGEAVNEEKEFRIYMVNPENRRNNRFFIKEIPRKA